MADHYIIPGHLALKDITRIFSKIAINPGIQFNGIPCWIWQGSIITAKKSRYGVLYWRGKNAYIHRLMYVWTVGPVPPYRETGMTIDHLCRNTSCCNPAHLEMVTLRVNILRGTGPTAKSAAQTHCKNGHELAGHNLRTYGGERTCRICSNIYNRAMQQRLRAKKRASRQ